MASLATSRELGGSPSLTLRKGKELALQVQREPLEQDRFGAAGPALPSIYAALAARPPEARNSRVMSLMGRGGLKK
jgi:hypothetical protein